MSTFQNPGLNKLVAALKQVSDPYQSKNGLTVTALCPVHDDHNPSLFITEKNDGTPLIFCQGCREKGPGVADALGMDWTEVVGHGKPYRRPHKTGHSHAALVRTAQALIYESFLILSDPSVQQQISPDARMKLARAAGTLEGIANEMRRSDK